MIVVHSHELVILPAGDLVGDLLTVDDGGHPVLHVLAGRLFLVADRFDPNVSHADLAPVGSFAEPALAGFHAVEGFPVDTADAQPLVLLFLKHSLLHHEIGHVLGNDRLRMEAALLLTDVLQCGRGERESYRLPALQHLHRDLAHIVLPDDTVDDIEPCGDRMVFQRTGGQDRHLILPEVIDQVAVDGRGLHGQRPGPFVNDDAVPGQDLAELVLREIDVRGDELRVWLRLLGGDRTRLDLWNDVPEFHQHILTVTRRRLSPCSLVPLVVEPVAAVLKLARLDPPVGTVGDEWGSAITEFPADPAQVESLLLTWRPAEHPAPGPKVPERTCRPAVFSLADPVAVEPHDDTPVGVTSMDIVLRQIEVPAHDRREGFVGLPVRRVRSPVRECHQTLAGQGIGEERGVMSLHGQQHVAAASDETRLHAVAPERVLQFRGDSHIMAQYV